MPKDSPRNRAMSTIQEISTCRNFGAWLSERKPDAEIEKLYSGRPAKRKRRKSLTSIIKGNVKAALAAGLTIRAIRPDGEILVGDVQEEDVNPWDPVIAAVEP